MGLCNFWHKLLRLFLGYSVWWLVGGSVRAHITLAIHVPLLLQAWSMGLSHGHSDRCYRAWSV